MSDLQPLFLRYLAVGVARDVGNLDLDPVHGASEPVNRVVPRDGRPVVGADLERLVAREWERLRPLDPSLANLPVVDEQRHGSAFRRPAAVILEIHAHAVRSRRQKLGTLDVVQIDAVEVVAVGGRPP